MGDIQLGKDVVFYIKTDLPPEQINAAGIEIYRQWVEFAVGAGSLGGRSLRYPTGQYASSIRLSHPTSTTVAIVADESVAKEALFLETGHKAVDLKKRLLMGKVYKMHNLAFHPSEVKSGATGGYRRQRVTTNLGTTPAMWADIRTAEETGFARFGPETPSDKWVIPEMIPYSPAGLLAQWFINQVRGQK